METPEQGPARVPFDEELLEISYRWLNDPEIQALTMGRPVDREGQRQWYAGLPDRTDYAIWGIRYDGRPVGALGLKAIGVDDGAEYFMYLGERWAWGRGIAAWAFAEMTAEARRRGLKYFYGRTLKTNERSLHVNFRHGYRIARDEGDTYWLVYDL